MTAENSPPESPSTSSRRRSSFVPAQKITELFGRSPGAAPTAYPGPIATAAANAQAHQRRRMSASTFGLAGTSPTQAGAFAAGSRAHQESVGSGHYHNGDTNESAVEDGEASSLGSTPNTPFARRISFGARAMGSVRGSISGSNGEGFNWSEQIRNRAQRSSSAAAAAGSPSNAGSTMPPSAPSPPAPILEAPKPPRSRAPDHFQERILKGDFYMD